MKTTSPGALPWALAAWAGSSWVLADGAAGFAAELILGLFRTVLQPRAWFWVT